MADGRQPTDNFQIFKLAHYPISTLAHFQIFKFPFSLNFTTFVPQTYTLPIWKTLNKKRLRLLPGT
jgi:hypothetical protein